MRTTAVQANVTSKRRFKNNRKNTWGTGLIFDHEIDSIQNVTVAAGFTREISENANKTAYYSNAYALGLAYNFVHIYLWFRLCSQRY